LWCNDYTNTTKAWAINIASQGAGAFKDQGECRDERRLYPENKLFDNCDINNPELKHVHSNLGFTYWRNDEPEFPKIPCSQNMILKDISSDCNSQGQLVSGCVALVPITSGNADDYFAIVPTLPDGTERQLLVNDLLRYYSSEGDMIKVKTLLNNETDINYKMLYAEILLEESNITAALTVINNMSSDSPEKADYVSFFSVLLYTVQNNVNLDELPEDKINTLESLALGRSIGAYRAQSVLIEYYSKKFPLIVETEAGLEYRSKRGAEDSNTIPPLTIQPNPVDDILQINLSNNYYGIKEIGIFSLDGRLLIGQKIESNLFNVELKTDKLESGVYILTVKDLKDKEFQIKFIKN
ncbi:MAG: T9SS type A sorting domain-containing protein, partial [Saprospiraceae bacterium]|nr:T9SS type A sorting domain-containing protein [Saprospiraceae bacterium]